MILERTVRFFSLKKSRGIVVALLLLSFVAPALLLSLPKNAQAQVPVWDAPNTPNQYLTGVATLFEKLKDFGLDAAAWVGAKMIIRQITANLVDWINNGFDGNPAFIADPGAFFMSVGDNVLGEIIFESGLSFLCNPIRPLEFNIKASLLYSYQGPTRNNYTCTIDEIFGVGADYLSYIDGQATGVMARGWDQWLVITQNQQNNIYGANHIAGSEVGARLAGSKSLNKEVAGWNKGFKSVTDEVNGLIKTPGSFVQDQLYNVMQSDVRQLEAADEIAEMINAVSGALLNQVLTQGLSSLTQGSSQSRYTNQLRNANPTDYYYRVSSSDNTTWSSGANSANSDAQGEFQDQYGEQVDQTTSAINSSTLSQQEPKIKLNDLTMQQSCTAASDMYSWGGFGPEQAVDGSMTTLAKTNCLGNATSYPIPTFAQPSWWRVQLAQPEYLDEIQLRTPDSTAIKGFYNFLPSTGAACSVPYVGGCVPARIILGFVDGTSAEIPLNDNIIGNTVPANGAVGQLVKTLWRDYRRMKVSTIEVQAWRGAEGAQGLWLSEIEIFRSIRPVLDARTVPALISSTTAMQAGGFDPRPVAWVKGKYYPSLYPTEDASPAPDNWVAGWRNPTDIPQDDIDVRVLNSSTNVEIAPISTAPLRYQLQPGSYRFEYTSTMDFLTSATSTRVLTVQP